MRSIIASLIFSACVASGQVVTNMVIAVVVQFDNGNSATNFIQVAQPQLAAVKYFVAKNNADTNSTPTTVRKWTGDRIEASMYRMREQYKQQRISDIHTALRRVESATDIDAIEAEVNRVAPAPVVNETEEQVEQPTP